MAKIILPGWTRRRMRQEEFQLNIDDSTLTIRASWLLQRVVRYSTNVDLGKSQGTYSSPPLIIRRTSMMGTDMRPATSQRDRSLNEHRHDTLSFVRRRDVNRNAEAPRG